MPAHLPASDYGGMDPASARYLIRINGHLGVTLFAAFPALAWKRQGPETALTGMLDRPALHGVLAEVEAVGLDPFRVRPPPPDLFEARQRTPEESGDSRSP